jgi:hypothetical protein
MMTLKNGLKEGEDLDLHRRWVDENLASRRRNGVEAGRRAMTILSSHMEEAS